jgi:hypothetical protein
MNVCAHSAENEQIYQDGEKSFSPKKIAEKFAQRVNSDL